MAFRRREFLAVCCLAFIQSCIWNLTVLLFPLYSRQLGASGLVLGILCGLPHVLFVVWGIPGGLLGSSLGEARIFRWSLLTGVVAAALYYSGGSVWLLALPQLLLGFGHALFWPSEAAYMAGVIPEHRRARMMGLVMSLNTLGAVLGPAAGGVLAQYYGYRSVFLVHGGLSATGLAICGLLPAGGHGVGAGSIRGLVSGSISLGRKVLVNRTLRITSALSFATFAFYTLVETFFPLFLEDLGFHVAAIGGIITVRTVSMTSFRIASGGFLGKIRLVPAALMGLTLGAATMVIAAVGGMPGRAYLLMACSAAVGVLAGAIPVLTFLTVASATEAEERPIAMGLDQTVQSAGQMLAAGLFGWLSGVTGLRTTLWAGSAGVMAMAVAVGLWWGSGRRLQ